MVSILNSFRIFFAVSFFLPFEKFYPLIWKLKMKIAWFNTCCFLCCLSFLWVAFQLASWQSLVGGEVHHILVTFKRNIRLLITIVISYHLFFEKSYWVSSLNRINKITNSTFIVEFGEYLRILADFFWGLCSLPWNFTCVLHIVVCCLLFCFVFTVLGIKPKVLCMLVK